MKADLFSNEVDAKTLDSAWRGISRRRAHVRRVRRAWAAAPLVVAVVLALVLAIDRFAPGPRVLALANGSPLPGDWSGAAARVVAFDDGSRMELGPDTRLRKAERASDPARVDLVLESGVATFDIKPGGPRAWMIDAGGARVRVLGTRFTVQRDHGHVHVSVERGKVRVESARLDSGARDLIAGQEVDIPAVVAGTPAAVPPPATTVPLVASVIPVGDLPAPPAPKVTSAAPSPSPRVVPASAPQAPRPSDPMARADAARSAGQPREAVAILTSVVDDGEPRAALAAFTVGKIHAEELGEQANGADWFERAIQLGLPVGLDEDAHVRAIECHARAGHAADARRLAERYEAKFPEGRHLLRVRRWKR